MIQRALQKTFRSTFRSFPVVALIGPRQVGKTTLALQLARVVKPAPVYLDLELPSDEAKLTDPQLFFERFPDRLVVIDEAQRPNRGVDFMNPEEILDRRLAGSLPPDQTVIPLRRGLM